METNLTDERARFVRDFESGHWSMTELCERYGVSRPTGYKWMARRAGGAGFADRSHAPHQCPHRTSADVEALIVAARQEYGWGAKKLRQVLRTRYPAQPWPARNRVSVRAVLGGAEWTAIGNWLGLLDLVPTTAEGTLIGHLGPDIMADDFEPGGAAEAVRRLEADLPDHAAVAA